MTRNWVSGGGALLAALVLAGTASAGPLELLQARAARIRSWSARCELTTYALIGERAVTYKGQGRVWYQAPDRVRVETERLLAQGVRGDACPVVRIEREGRYYGARKCNEDAPPFFQEVDPLPAGSDMRVSRVPSMDFLRPPFPTAALLAGVRILSAGEDSLAGRPAHRLALQAGRRGGYSGDRVNWWVDRERLCLLREETVDAQGKVVGAYTFDDIVELAPGTYVPTRLVHYTPEGKMDIICTFKDVKLDAPLADSLFAAPVLTPPAGDD